MSLLPLEKNTQKLFLPNFALNIAVRRVLPLTLILLNGTLVYDIFKDSKHSIYVTLLVYIGFNLCFIGMWCFAYILARKLAPYVQVEGKHIRFYHWNFFSHWNDSEDLLIEEIDHIKIRLEGYLGAGGYMVERRIYVVLKNGNHIKVHENFFGPMKKFYESLCIELEKITRKPVVTEESHTC